MIKDALEANETAAPNDFEIARLRAALPEYFDMDGGFMLDRLQDALRAGEVNLTREGYELRFLGKSYAKYLTSTKPETVMVPDLEHNAESTNEASENLYIVGDNIDALKHLLGSYSGLVKCMYIDPPYNTGSDGFVYNDDFGFTAQTLVDKVGLGEDEARRVIDLQGRSSHSAWMTFMYPRLELAKALLADDGVIFISIDDNEQANLKLLCDEIFGPSSFVSSFVWVNNLKGRQISGAGPVQTKEYVLCYARNIDAIQEFVGKIAQLKRLMPDGYKGLDYNLLHDERGPFVIKNELYNTNSRFNEVTRANLVFDIYYNPSSGEVLTASLGEFESIPGFVKIGPHRNANGRHKYHAFRWGRSKIEAEAFDLHFVETASGWKVFTKVRTVDSTALKDLVLGMSTSTGSASLKALDLADVFENPKPPSLVQLFVETQSDKQALCLDFFSGSSTTAHALMDLNAADGGRRRYILVQIPERVPAGSAAASAGFQTIDEIGRERIKRAAAKIESDTAADIDYGFRLFRLEEPSERTLDELHSFDPGANDALVSGDFVSKFDLNGTPGEEVALSTWLLQDGFGLTPAVQIVQLDQYKLYACGDSGYVIQPGLTSGDVLALVSKFEKGELDLNRVVVFGYSVTFSVLHELKQNLKALRADRTVSLIERF